MFIVNAEKPGDYNNDGCVREDDYFIFSEHYNNLEIPAEDNPANLNGDDDVTMDDFFYFSELVNQDVVAGCVAGSDGVAGGVAGAGDEDGGFSDEGKERRQENAVDANGDKEVDDKDDKELKTEDKVFVPQAVFVDAAYIGNGEVLLRWERSVLSERELNGEIAGEVVLNKISGMFSFDMITGRINFIDKILDWLEKFFTGEIRASRVGDEHSEMEEMEVKYKVYRENSLGNNLQIGLVNDGECIGVCEFKDKVDESGTYGYKVEACLDDVCRSSNVVNVGVVLFAEDVEGGNLGDAVNVVDATDVANAVDTSDVANAAGDDDGGKVEDGNVGKGVTGEQACNPAILMQEVSGLFGDKEALKIKWNNEIVPCCSKINSNPDANENDKIACSNVGGIV